MTFYISKFILGILFTLFAEILAIIMFTISMQNKVKNSIKK